MPGFGMAPSSCPAQQSGRCGTVHPMGWKLTTVVAAGILLTGCAASSATSTPPAEQPSATRAAPSDQPGSEQPSTEPTETQDGDWKIADVKVKNTYGIAEGTIRATNVTGEPRTATFTVTVFDPSGSVATTLSGIATDVAPGKTVTVQVAGSDKLPKKYTTEVQVDASF